MEELTPEEIFKQDNILLASKLKSLVHSAIDRANEMVIGSERIEEVYTAVKIAEVAGKMTGIVQEKQTINMQINQISGFTFIEVDKQRIIQERETNQMIQDSNIVGSLA
jgi:hypothetical protein